MLNAALSVPSGPLTPQRVDVFVPENGTERPLIVCFHGGWWHAGAHADLRALCLILAEHGWPCASVGMRHLQTANSSEGGRNGTDLTDDAAAGMTKAVEEARLLGWSGNGLITLGSGSGSLTALVLAHRSGKDGKPGIPPVRAAIACGLTPSLDHHDGWAQALTKTIDQFAGSQRHALSPIHLKPEHYPPVLILHGDADVDVPAKLAQRFHQRISESGETSQIVILSGVAHHFLEHPFQPAGRAALEHILPYLTEHGGTKDRGPEEWFIGHRAGA